MTPRPAAALILARDVDERLELLMVRRTPAARFMPGVWVFPGGALDPGDGEGQPGFERAAVRELREEAGITLGPSAKLVALARWVTPTPGPIRFDTWFFVAEAPAGASAEVDGAEIVDFRWLAPTQALDAHTSGALPLPFPTVRQLQELSGLESVAALIEHADGSDLRPIEPRWIGSGDQRRLVLPGEPDY